MFIIRQGTPPIKAINYEIIKRTFNLIYGRLPEEQKKNEILEIEALIKVKFD